MKLHHIALCVALGLGVSAQAGTGHAHDDGHAAKPLHGGVVAEASHLTFELVPQAEKITLHVRDHGKPAKADGGSAKLTVLSGTTKAVIELAPSGAGQLSAPLQAPVAAGSKAVALVKLPGKKPAQVRFALP